MENNNEGDSSASTEVENTNVLDQNSLAAMISASKAQPESEGETEQIEETTEVSEQSEVTEQAEEPTETEILSQESEAETEDEDLEETDEADSEEDVLLQFEKTKKKMRKRIDKATKNWRTAEEENESLRKEIEDLKASQSTSAPQSKPEGLVHKVASAESVEDLIQVQETAKAVSANVDDLLDEMIDNGDSEIEYNGQVFTRQELRNAKKEADEVLNTHINNKAQLFQQRTEFDKQALNDFKFLADQESEGYKFVEQLMGDPSFNQFMNSRPEQFYILGLLAEGKASLDARNNQQKSSQEKGKTEETQKVASTPKIAPSVPGLKNSVAPARASGQQIAQNKRKEILSRDRLDATGLAQLIQASKE